MSLVLRSNKIATNYIGNINGILGDQDWVGFFDFERGEYIKNVNGTKTALAEGDILVATSDLNLARQPQTQDRFGNKSIVTDPNQVRWWAQSGRYGVLVESGSANWFRNSSNPQTQIISILAGSTMVASCIGPGSLVITGASIDPITVTQSTPATITPQSQSSAYTINVEVVGQLSHAQVARIGGYASIGTPVTTGPTASDITPSPDLIEINPTILSEILNTDSPVTILFQTVPMFMTQDTRSTKEETRLVIETDDLVAAFGLNRTPTTIGGRIVSNFKSNAASQFSGSGGSVAYTFNDPITQAIQVGDFGAAHGINGTLSQKPSSATGLNKISRIRLATNIATPFQQQGGNCIFTKMAIYNRLLSDEEIMKISNSWL